MLTVQSVLSPRQCLVAARKTREQEEFVMQKASENKQIQAACPCRLHGMSAPFAESLFK